ncbi:MAG: Holliday junction resolvase Hjc [Candidatus Diapherotrites archaeon]
MAQYRKGANAERELIHKLYDMGFSVVRIAGSGGTSLPSCDILALSPEKKLAIECKAWANENLSIKDAQMQELEEWSKKAGIEFLIAWKVPHKGWYFLPKELFKKTGKAYSLSLKKAMKYGMDITIATGKQKTLLTKTTK